LKGQPSYIETYGFLPEPCVRLLESGPDGEELMLRVIAKIGGGYVRIPVQLTPGCDLVTDLGAADAEAVWRVWRGKGSLGEIRVHFPRMSVAHQKARRGRLLALLAAGVTVREAARRLNVTERTAYAMKARADFLGETAGGVRRQLDLFPS
jgi:DNA-binding CsgD family transcriptional regulator